MSEPDADSHFAEPAQPGWQSLPTPVLVITAGGSATAVNAAFSAFTGIASTVALGAGWRSVLDVAAQAPLLRALAAERDFTLQLSLGRMARASAVQGAAWVDCTARWVLDDVEAMFWHFRHLQGREAWQVDGPLIERYQPPLGSVVAQRFAWARSISDEAVAAGVVYRQRLRTALAQTLGRDGVLLMPTMPDVAPRIADDEAGLEGYRNRATQMLCVAGLTGFPQLSLPLATRLGAPLGLSLLGPPGSDRGLVRLAERIAAG